MESNLEQRMKKYAKRNKRKKIWMKVLSVLSAVVVFCTTYALILPAITQEREVFCGKEEHIHSEACLAKEEKILVCEIPEEEAHFHSDECFENLLVCETEENHVHSEECYSEEELICGKPENHLHSEECCENSLICEVPETEGHIHCGECYKTEIVQCEAEEHSHSLSCYSDETADVETEEQWTASFSSEDMGETVSENLIKIAKSQLGYHESTKNYIVLDDGETVKGRSRYGEWYGEPYADWNLLFAGFCLEYAKAEIPFDADIENWIGILSSPETDIYRNSGEHEALPGDLVFFDENSDGKPDRAGIIIEITETEYKTVIGDYGDGVRPAAIPKTDGTVSGFAAIAIPSPYHCGLEEHIHEERCFDENGNLFCGFEEHIHCEACLEEKQEEPEPEQETGPEYQCGLDEHKHSEECYDEDGNLVCGIEEHAHGEECLSEEPEAEYFCGFDEHEHSEECYGEDGNLVCEIEEHAHGEECLSEKPEAEYFCGFDEHEHSEECYGEDGNLVCEIEEHIHTEECGISFESLPEEERVRIEEVIAMIESLPTADEIDAKIIEFEDAEDYEGEEAWLTEIYQKVGFAYKYYMDLPENHRRFVTNSEKLMELEYIWSVAFLIETEIGKTAEYSADMFNSWQQFIIYTEGENGYYAISGSGGAVPISIANDGTIFANVSNRNEILWSFASDGAGGYRIRNASSRRYLHAFGNNGSGVTTTNAYSGFVEESSGGAKIRSNSSDYARLDEENKIFVHTSDSSEAAVYNFGTYSSGTEVYVWLDGTWGGAAFLSGSENSVHTVVSGGKIVLPTEWKSPDSYRYKVRGWYDIIGKKYYEAGAEAEITESTVFYPDWVPYTYDIGQYNAEAANTVSTSEFVTTKVFDYSPFFNLPYVEAKVTVNASGHSETWNLTDANDFIFRDWNPGMFTSPNNGTSGINGYTEYAENPGIMNSSLLELLFGTGTEVPGKNYLGTGDHLFQYCDDPANTEYYGYYYYDSNYHAASYNQSAGRFYIYDYLSSADTAHTADFLPLNSPYVNTNGRPVLTYYDSGQYGEYEGTTHYEYAGGSGVSAEYWFGMQTDIKFYLANKPGELDSDGNTVNRGINGEELVFEFTGDDDVWVFVDGELVLDIGGIHQAVSGSINFSTGEVYVNGSRKTGVTDLEPGEHVLTMYYLERGGGDSNCRIKFNISTRYGLTLMKEDVLTRQLLDGAEFTVYTNKSCTDEASLWTSHEAYEAGETPRSTFAVTDGEASFWGLAAGNTYYIKETKYPTNGGYGVANGIIVMKLNSKGVASFDVIPDPNGNGSDLSGGFTVHGFRIDVENHRAYLVATNGKEDYGDEVTSVTVKKEWADGADHSKDSVTVYILANGFRIQEAILNENNDWTHTWKNLPVKGDSGKEVTYSVEEGTVPGYFGTISVLKADSGGTGEFKQVSSFTDGKSYVIVSNNAPLYATESAGIGRNWNISIPQFFSGGKWTADVKGNTVSLTNDHGLTLYYSNSGGNRFFSVSKSPPGGTNLSFVNNMIAYNEGGKLWYMTWGEGQTVLAGEWGGPTVVLYEEISEETVVENGFLITNTPISEAEKVSFRVEKHWDTGPLATEEDYEQLLITFKLLGDGTETGMEAVLNLKNGWQYTFTELPKYNMNGTEIEYSVEEVFFSKDWRTEYGEIIQTGENSFETTVTNVYNLGYELPKTGGGGNIIGITGGIVVLAASSGLIYRQKFKKRRKEDDSS
ncbi:MAG: Cna B-type domain-containing protein [Ruminococcaceae bacterium]|nr:Cna B-type domain-containing protein [Oscillospiraceae bacterium]